MTIAGWIASISLLISITFLILAIYLYPKVMEIMSNPKIPVLLSIDGGKEKLESSYLFQGGKAIPDGTYLINVFERSGGAPITTTVVSIQDHPTSSTVMKKSEAISLLEQSTSNRIVSLIYLGSNIIRN